MFWVMSKFMTMHWSNAFFWLKLSNVTRHLSFFRNKIVLFLTITLLIFLHQTLKFKQLTTNLFVIKLCNFNTRLQHCEHGTTGFIPTNNWMQAWVFRCFLTQSLIVLVLRFPDTVSKRKRQMLCHYDVPEKFLKNVGCTAWCLPLSSHTDCRLLSVKFGVC